MAGQSRPTRGGSVPTSVAPRTHNCPESHVAGLAQRLLFEETSHRKEAAVNVRDLMTKQPLTVSPDTPVVDARRMMAERRIRHLLVTDGGRLAGIVTDRDIRLNLPSPATSLSVWEINYLLGRMPVGSIMTTTVITVQPDRDAVAAAGLMLDHKIGALPVVDAGTVVGILTETDILRAFVAMAAPTLATA